MLFLLIFAIGIISIPYVQTRIIQKATDNILLKTGHRLSLDYINIRWFDTIIIRDLDLWDTGGRKMIHIDKLILDFKLVRLVAGADINFDQAILVGPNVEMYNDGPNQEFNLNYFIYKIKEEFRKNSQKKGKAFVVDDVVIKNGRFKLFRLDKEQILNRFDQYHFTLKDINLEAVSFLIQKGLISLDAKNLQCVDSMTNLNVKKLSTHYEYTGTSMIFQELTAEIGKSTLNESMVFNYLQPSSLKYFADSVRIVASIKRSVLHSSDLGKFIPSVKSYSQFYRLNGFLEGKISAMHAKNLTIGFGKSSRIFGFIDTYGLPNLEETFINAQITTSRINVMDLAPYTNQDNLHRLRKFGYMEVKGSFAGFLNDFVSNASFKTEIGEFDTDINLKINDAHPGESTYRGKLVTKDFNLGIFLADTSTFQMVDLNGQIEGKGFTKENARFDLKSEISRLGYKNYDYRNIITDATFANQFFNGTLIIEDPFLKFNADASIDLREGKNTIQIEARLDTAVLMPLNITKKPAFVKSNVLVNVKGLKLDDMVGDIDLQNTFIGYEDRFLHIDTLSVVSERDSLGRSLIIRSPLVRVHLFGDFNYTDFFRDISSTLKEYTLALKNDSQRTETYYSKKHTDYSDYYYLDYDVQFDDFNPVLSLIAPGLYISENTSITGNYTGGPLITFEVHTQPKRLDIYDYSFRDSELNINSSKLADSSSIYARVELTSRRQFYQKKARAQNLNFKVDWKEDWIDFRLGLKQYRSENYVKLTGNIDFLPDETRMHIDSSELYLIKKMWHFNSDHLVVQTKNNYRFKNLKLECDDQLIEADGYLSEDPEKKLRINVKHFEIQNINPLLSKKLNGIMDGTLEMKNFYGDKLINSHWTLDHLTINDFPVGDVTASSDYENEAERFNVRLNISREGSETMDIKGYLYPASSQDQMALSAAFSDYNLDMVEPFISVLASNVSGYLNGNMKITGRFSHPLVKGTGVISDGELMFNYLNTHYSLEGPVEFDNDQIRINNMTISDDENHRGTITGKITHNGFKEPLYDITFSIHNMMVLNTTVKENNLYYGTAFATGDIRIFGKQKNLKITASARTEKNTRFFIPLNGTTEVEQQDFITFVQPRDTLSDKSNDEEDDGWNSGPDNKATRLEGLTLNLDLDITPDAYCEIIFDITSGDIIRGRGKGNIKLQIDTKGDFEMFGQYEIQEGAYNFTLYNIINKEFNILPGSLITWNGDPYAATLDITASYRQMASLAPIFNATEEDINNNPEIHRKYPAYVMLFIKGDLRYPDINFDIKVEDYPKNAIFNGVSFETQMLAFKNKLATDEQELKRQVFSLIILKNFSRENAFNVGGSIGKSVSEFISNQISYWVTQFDENLIIDVDLGSMDKEAFNTFQFRMSYSFLEGRLRITRNGGFTNQDNSADVVSVLGDWSVEYLLTPDGKYRVKIYNKTNYNTLNPQLQNTATTAGFSLMHTQSFDEWRELFGKARKKAMEKRNNSGDLKEVTKNQGK